MSFVAGATRGEAGVGRAHVVEVTVARWAEEGAAVGESESVNPPALDGVIGTRPY